MLCEKFYNHVNHKQDAKKLIDAFAEFAKAQSIDRPTVIRILEDTFRAVIKQRFGQDSNFEVVINLDQGDMQIWRYREIIDDNSDKAGMHDKIILSEAKQIESDFEVGEQVADEIDLGDFGRRAVFIAKQALISTMQSIRANAIIEKYVNRIGDLINIEVNHSYGKETILVDEDGYELVMPRAQQISKDRFRKGDYIKAVIHEIQNNGTKHRVILSRASPKFLQALLENEIPEIKEGVIEIKDIVREPGERAKVVVRTFNENVDPVGACIGPRGSRISGIVRELHNENIDIINYTDSIDLYISRALNPAKVSSIKHLKNNRVAVYLRPDQVAKAIGVGGHNIKLASKLVGLDIDVYREVNNSDEDVLLDEFTDEINPKIIDDLKKMGINTAKEVLKLSQDEIKEKLLLEHSEIVNLYKVLAQEFTN